MLGPAAAFGVHAAARLSDALDFLLCLIRPDLEFIENDVLGDHSRTMGDRVEDIHLTPSR